MKVWAKTKEYSEGKFLVVRRDGTVPEWPHFVLGARDPAVPYAMRAYADKAAELGYDPEYVDSIRELATDFDDYRENEGDGDADAAPHRTDNPAVIAAMRGEPATILVSTGPNKRKGGDVEAGSPPVQLPRWKCHKEVDAARIGLIACREDGRRDLVLDGAGVARVESGWYHKHKPEPGGYFVRYADGYESYSPAAAFEEGYTRIGGAK